MTGRDLAILVIMLLAVYLPKAVPLLLLGDRISPGVQRWLRYVAPAVLSAMVAPAILVSDGALKVPGLSQVPFLVTLVITIITRRFLVAVGAGLASLVLITLLGV